MANKFKEINLKDKAELNDTLIKKPTSKANTSELKTQKKGVLAKGISSIFNGTFLSTEKNIRHLPYLLFLSVFAILYIANGYFADNKIREVNKFSNEIKELHSEFISSKSDIMMASKQSEVAKAVEVLGLKEPIEMPEKIEVDSIELYKEY